MRPIHASFCKFSKLSNSGISLNWFKIDEVTNCKTTAYILAHSVDDTAKLDLKFRKGGFNSVSQLETVFTRL